MHWLFSLCPRKINFTFFEDNKTRNTDIYTKKNRIFDQFFKQIKHEHPLMWVPVTFNTQFINT